MEKKCSVNCVSEVVECWSLAIVHSSTIQWGRDRAEREALISKIYHLRFSRDTYLNAKYLDLSKIQLLGFHMQCSQGLQSYSRNKIKKKIEQLKFRQVFSGLATLTNRMLFIFFFFGLFFYPLPSKKQKNTNMLFCYRVSSLLSCFWVSKENVTRKELK